MLRVSRQQLSDTLSHLSQRLPNEGLGLWAGRRGRVERVIPLANVSPRPRAAYAADPGELLRAVRGLEEAGLELLAIFHSHPTGPARPSERDRAQAFWRVPYVIVAIETGEVRAWKLPEQEEVALHVD